MKPAEFIALLTAYTNNTANIRTFNRPWEVSSEQTLDTIASSVGYVVSLIQDRVDHNVFCKKQESCLLLYNGEEVLTSATETLYWTLSMMVKPLVEIDNTTSLAGKSLQLMVNGATGEVMNLSKGMLETQLVVPKEINWESEDAPASYGYYHAYHTPCCFVAISSYRPLENLDEVFQGKYDKSDAIQQAHAFDTFLEAGNFLANATALGKYIAEIPHPKEKLESFKKNGLGQEMRVIIDYFHPSGIEAVASSHFLNKHPMPSSLNEELSRLKAAFSSPTAETGGEYKPNRTNLEKANGGI